MKKFILLLIPVLFLCGCASENSKNDNQNKKELEQEYDKLHIEHQTVCSKSAFDDTGDLDGITGLSVFHYVNYDSLEDTKFTVDFHTLYYFNTYENAVKFKKENEEDWKNAEIDIEENIDDRTGSIDVSTDFDYFEVKYDGTVRDYIHKLQNDEYECKTFDITNKKDTN